MAVTEEFAEENGLATLSDMATYMDENPDSTVCVESEFAARPDGIKGMVKAYDMTIPDSSIKSSSAPASSTSRSTRASATSARCSRPTAASRRWA